MFSKPIGTAALAIVLLLVGCAPSVIRREWRREEGIEALLRLAAAPLEHLRDLTAEATIAAEREGHREQGLALIQCQGADLLRLEVRGPLYTLLFAALIQGDTLTVWGPGVGGAWKGAVDGPLLAYLTGVELKGGDLKEILLGVVAPASIDSAKRIEYVGAGQAVVPLAGKEVVRRLWVDLDRGLVTREEVSLPEGPVLWERRLRDYRWVGSLLLPRKVELRQGRMAIVLNYRRYLLDQGVSASRLLQGVPREGVRWFDPREEAGD